MTIVQKNTPVLHRVAEKVPLEKIQTSNIQNVIARMKEALAGETDGVAIAAPQIGKSLRIFVVSGKAFSILERGTKHEHKETPVAEIPPDAVFINPVITKLSRKKTAIDEGCLSIRHWYGKVERHEKATVRAYDEQGKRFERGGSGLLAQIFQHEVDHLDGILFTDKARDLQEIHPNNNEPAA